MLRILRILGTACHSASAARRKKRSLEGVGIFICLCIESSLDMSSIGYFVTTEHQSRPAQQSLEVLMPPVLFNLLHRYLGVMNLFVQAPKIILQCLCLRSEKSYLAT